MKPRLLLITLALLAGCGYGSTAETTPVPVTPASPATTPPPLILNDTTLPETTTTTSATLPSLASITFAGDTSLTHGLADRDPFGEIGTALGGSGSVWVNLETAVAEEGVGTPIEDKSYVFRSPPETAQLMADAGISGAALANNHSLDYGPEGLMRTLELLDSGGVASAGGGVNRDDAYAPVIFRLGDHTVAVLSFSRVLPEAGWTAGTDSPGLASAYSPYVDRTEEAVRNAASQADLVFVMVHWGVERATCPERYQLDLAQRWAEAGADAIVGSHPHVLQGIERIGNTWVVYSTGNFAFPSANTDETARTALFHFEIIDGDVEMKVEPVRIVAGRPQPADSEETQTILGLLAARSWGIGFSDDGHVLAGNVGTACPR